MHIYNLGQKFKSVAKEFANSVAVKTENDITDYNSLDKQSDQFANYLQSIDIAIGDVICIAGEKTLLSIVCILGALKAGVIYSVFDPQSPIERLGKIFGQCRPKAVFCSVNLFSKIKNIGFKSIDITSLHLSSFTQADNCRLIVRQEKITANSPAYIMFTSGSTGFPKGAVMTHQNVLNLIAWSKQTYGFDKNDVFTSVNPIYFDNSVFDVYSSLFTGASLALFDHETVQNPSKLIRLINEFRCTTWFSVPSMLMYLQTLRAFSTNNMSYIKRIIFGGEGYPKAKLRSLFDLYSDRIEFYNVYGPTECTCICSSYKVSQDDFQDLNGFLPLGKLISNFDCLIVDDELKLVEADQVGELILRGPNVGLGYFQDGERTQMSFIQNPMHDAYKDIVYCTGDLVYFKSDDGKIYIVGRRDNQIKHMGYRIELEEIENAISLIDTVRENAVVHCEIRGLSQIVAFITGKNGTVDEKILRGELKEIIPQYMIPTKFEFVEILPRSANGKLDRKKLKSDYMGQLVNG
jgi:D-alanine--poly(phosphoribitol) ligase subunit 1